MIKTIKAAILVTSMALAFAPANAESNKHVQDTAKAEEHFKHELDFKTSPFGTKKVVDGEVKNVTIVDVRNAASYKDGHVPGAINIPEGDDQDFQGDETHFKGLRKDGFNYVYCYNRDCNLAQRAARKFASLGYPVKEMTGGFDAWKEKKYPVEK
jgi:rhodanese-related sulfurtransferase